MKSKNQAILIALVLVLTISLNDPNCHVFVGSNCHTCNSGYYINGDGIHGICVAGNVQCATYTNDGTGRCLTCKQVGYAVVAGNCVALITINPWCALFVSGSTLCQTCKPGYYINGDGIHGICVAGNQQCATYTNDGTGRCLTCKQVGYVVVAGNCVAKLTIDPWCVEYYPGTTLCKSCSTGYYVNGNGLYGICVAGNQQCATYTNDGTGRCLTCKQVGYVVVAGNCVAQITINPWCGSFYPGTVICQSCVAGYFIEPSTWICTPANQRCLTYNMIGGSCTSCQYPYHLDGSSPTLCVYP